MAVMVNGADSTDTGYNSYNETVYNTSRDVTLTQNADDPNSGEIYDGSQATGTPIGTWVMYGNGYIKFTFSETLKGTGGRDSGDTVYYGVVRPAWLGDQNRSGFTITCLGQTVLRGSQDRGDRVSLRKFAVGSCNCGAIAV